jgi:hypothetical protein
LTTAFSPALKPLVPAAAPPELEELLLLELVLDPPQAASPALTLAAMAIAARPRVLFMWVYPFS